MGRIAWYPVTLSYAKPVPSLSRGVWGGDGFAPRQAVLFSASITKRLSVGTMAFSVLRLRSSELGSRAHLP